MLAEGGRRRRRIGTRGFSGRKVVFFGFSFKFNTRNRVFSWEGWGHWESGEIGIEGNRERIQIKTIVHLEGKDRIGRRQGTW